MYLSRAPLPMNGGRKYCSSVPPAITTAGAVVPAIDAVAQEIDVAGLASIPSSCICHLARIE